MSKTLSEALSNLKAGETCEVKGKTYQAIEKRTGNLCVNCCQSGKKMCVDINCDENYVYYVELNKK